MTLELKETKVLKFNPNTLQDVRKEYDLDHQGMCQAIDILQEWALKQEHFVKKDFSKDYLERVIITAKGSTERAKTRLDKMCTLRTVLPGLFDKYHGKNELAKVGEKIISLNMPQLTEDNCRIYIMQYKGNVSAADLKEGFKFTIMLSEYMKLKDYPSNVHCIVDIRNLNVMDLVSNMNPIDFRNYVNVYVDGYGFRIKGLYVLSTSKTVNVFVNFIKPMFGAKVRQRIQTVLDMESLQKLLPKHLLPEDYGGEQMSINELYDIWVEELSSDENVNYMKETVQFCTNESMRQSDKVNEEHLGMPGSFKLLTVD